MNVGRGAGCVTVRTQPTHPSTQPALFSDLSLLPGHQRGRLEQSWAGAFRRKVFERLDERAFAGLYSDAASRPNVPTQITCLMKLGRGWLQQSR